MWNIYSQDLSQVYNGCIVILKYNDIPITVAMLTLHDKNIYVSHFGTDPEYEGKGYGKKTLNAIKKYAIDNGFENVRLDCDKSVCDFYKKCGFIMDTLHSTSNTYFYDWNSSINDIEENIDSLCNIRFEKNRTNKEENNKIIGIINLSISLSVQNIYSRYDTLFRRYTTLGNLGEAIIIIYDNNIPVCACYVHLHETKILYINYISTKIIENIENSIEYEKFLINYIKLYINEKNYNSFIINYLTPDGIKLYLSYGMNKYSNTSVIYDRV